MKFAIEYVPIENLIPYARNARQHSLTQVRQIANSITEFGFVNPVLVNENGDIVAGHGRILAANLLGLKEVPVICVGHLSDLQIKQLRLADNRIAQNSAWDKDLLQLELVDLADFGVDLAVLGFDANEIKIKDETDAVLDDKVANDFKSIFEVVVECENEIDQRHIFERLHGEGLKCRVLNM